MRESWKIKKVSPHFPYFNFPGHWPGKGKAWEKGKPEWSPLRWGNEKGFQKITRF